MKAIFLGTGAAEGIPSMFCRCNYCNYAREHNDENVRTRSSLKIGETYQIDFSPDANYQHLRETLDLFNLEHLMITHSHDDHLAFMEILVKECAVIRNDKTLNIYMSKSAADWFKNVMTAYGMTTIAKSKLKDKYSIIGLDYFADYKIGELKVQTIRGAHNSYGKDELSINYLIETPDKTKILYAVDTGFYRDETWEYLKGKRINKLIMECTFGGRNRGKHVFGHLDVYNYIDMLDTMKKIDFIDDDTDIYTTHINHKHNMLHNDLVEFFDKSDYDVRVAYDGLKLDI